MKLKIWYLKKSIYSANPRHDLICTDFVSSVLAIPWWRHQMETALLALCAGNSPVTGEFPAKRPVTRSFDVFFDLRLNKRLSKQSWGWWFEMPSCSLWHHCNVLQLQNYFCRAININVVSSQIYRINSLGFRFKLQFSEKNLKSCQEDGITKTMKHFPHIITMDLMPHIYIHNEIISP